MLNPNAICLNVLANGQTLTVRVISALGGDMYRVTDARETATDKQLIARNRTWAAPAARLRAR